MNFDEKFFQKIKFDQAILDDFLLNARDDLDIAKESKNAKIKFKFAYDALIKIGITLLAAEGYKVRSKTGHHFQILEKMARILKDPDISTVGNLIRQQRNADLYSGRSFISKKDAESYCDFASDVFKKAESYLKKS